jgi:hypothetical protein
MAILMTLCVLVAACSASLPSVSTLVKEAQPKQAAVSSDDSYVIGPGDVLAIDV